MPSIASIVTPSALLMTLANVKDLARLFADMGIHVIASLNVFCVQIKARVRMGLLRVHLTISPPCH
jgi:hypothetical protein